MSCGPLIRRARCGADRENSKAGTLQSRRFGGSVRGIAKPVALGGSPAASAGYPVGWRADMDVGSGR
jgi:hypothetical protein